MARTEAGASEPGLRDLMIVAALGTIQVRDPLAPSFGKARVVLFCCHHCESTVFDWSIV